MQCGVGGKPKKTPHFHLRTPAPPPGVTLPRIAWVRLKRLCTGVGRFHSCLYRWRMASTAACECGVEQSVVHVVLQCPIHRPGPQIQGAIFCFFLKNGRKSTSLEPLIGFLAFVVSKLWTLSLPSFLSRNRSTPRCAYYFVRFLLTWFSFAFVSI